ncbi:transcription activator of gluconeogenesis ERT1 [Roridomyces roridus]|uniref:Transcription activator of gluconeogenesis ERT1 n=1 Tax=Roridomyces roridus TaxID=1738132 RepID=A0AAD7FZX6_9AGAR|nr:transcription activator of gluconeogenesis ERT1 [Roridomyces roridus]
MSVSAAQPASMLQGFVTPDQTMAGQKQLQPAPIAPASQLPASLKRKQAQMSRQNTEEDAQNESSASAPAARTRGTRDGPKKKKASRACVHCQKAHLTCDDSRPCQRCIKRGIAANCTEGHRKKAKYLLDEEELAAGKQKTPRDKSDTVAEPAPVPPAPSQPPFEPNDMFDPVPFDPSFPFGSEAANLEYSILSAILGNPSPPETTTSPNPQYPTYEGMDFTSPRTDDFPASFPAQQIAVQPSETTTAPSFLSYPFPQTSEQDSQQYASQFPQELHPLQPRFPLDTRPRSPQLSSKDTPSVSATQPSYPHGIPDQARGGGSQLQNINDRITMPYDYTEGYHFLMKHLPGRFEKNDILRIVRALAIFRPSLIALQMPLSFDDEVFVEKCFQRSLLELDKLISFSGTPTVVWRRTGEICLVAPEFCMLTEWSLDELVGRKKYIYELFENQSVVEYWENFASHAFENTTQSVFSHCVLLKPSGAPVPCTFCFSIRRDLFDLPSVVIGQWLPLL